MIPRFVILFYSFIILLNISRGNCNKIPDVSSTLLRLHANYQRQPPHDASLYNILQVPPNATLAQIQKSYRRLSRLHHPDKHTAVCQNTNDNEDNNNKQKLESIRHAYDILKDDSTRFHYHQFGIIHVGQMLLLLTGSSNWMQQQQQVLNPEQELLLRYTGHLHQQQQHQSLKERHDARILAMATDLMERFLRPLILQQTISMSDIIHIIWRESCAMKRLPLGAQMIRCIGRAYKQAGQAVLQQQKQQSSILTHLGGRWAHIVKRRARHAKHWMEAATWQTRAFLQEQTLKRQQEKQQEQEEKKKNDNLKTIQYHSTNDDDDDEIFWNNDDSSSILDNDQDDYDYAYEERLKQEQWAKAQKIQTESLQIQALWKVVKIDLNRAVEEACDLCLDDNFFLSHNNNHYHHYGQDFHGWAGPNGEIISKEVGRIRAAEALVLIGKTMVQCSKEETSWVS